MSRKLLENINKKVYVLPVKFDDTELVEIPPSIGYLNAYDYTPKELSEIILKKINTKINKKIGSKISIDEMFIQIIKKYQDYFIRKDIVG